MKRTLLIIALAAVLSAGFSSCKKLRCKCVATGPEDKVETVLDKHINDCVEIADGDGTIYDSGVTVTCSY